MSHKFGKIVYINYLEKPKLQLEQNCLFLLIRKTQAWSAYKDGIL